MKLYEVTVEESRGEYSWYETALFYADSLDDAKEKAREFASTFRGEADYEDNDGTFVFEDGGFHVSIKGIEQTTKKEFMERAFKSALQN